MEVILKDFPQYLNEHQVSDITNLALSTLRNQRFQGRGIPYYKVGRAVRYNYQDVIDFMEACKISTDN